LPSPLAHALPLSGRVRRFRYGAGKRYPGATQRYCLLFLPTDVLADAAVSVLVIVGLLFGRFVGWIPLSGRVRRFRYRGWKGYPGATQRYCLLFLDGAPPFASLYGDVGHERFQVLILRT
jgi:hypothetical protein